MSQNNSVVTVEIVNEFLGFFGQMEIKVLHKR